MFNKKISLNSTKEIICESQIFRYFESSVHEKVGYDLDKFELLVKKGEDYKLKGLEIRVNPQILDKNKLCRINNSDFAKELLREIESYRMIFDEIYKICPNEELEKSSEQEKEFLFSINQNPEFKISTIKKDPMYWFASIKIKSFDNTEFVSYTPIQKNSSEFKDKIFIEAQLKKDSILNKTYKKIIEHHNKV